MSHLVALTAPQSAAHTVKRYPGFGILGADIPATGDNGGSPVLNDGVLPGSEYHWRVVTLPSSGTLTIHPDMSFELSGAADGDWAWQYRLYEDGTDQGVATVSVHVGAYAVTVAGSQQVNQSSAAAIRQTHLIGAANSQQVNTGVAASVSQSSITFVSAADSIQINQAAAAVIRQTHLIGVASSQQGNTASAAAILQTAPGSLLIADSQQINAASTAAILQTHLLGIADSQQGNTGSPSSVTSGSFTGSLSDADIARIVAALPSAADIAAAVLAMAQITPIHSDVRKVNGQTISGSGSEADPWGP